MGRGEVRQGDRADQPLHGRDRRPRSRRGRDDVDAAVKAAQGAFEAWGFGPPAARREVLTKAADLLQERAEEISGIVTEETGGTFGWGMFNCQLASGMLREAGAQAYAAVGQVIPSDIPGATAIARRLPAGVVVGIAPWNAPVILGTRAIATPLAYGNTVILKGSELCPRTHAQIVRCVQDAGAPEGVVNYLTNDPGDAAEVVEALIAHPGTRRINFTGSTKVGQDHRREVRRQPEAKCLLELGGKAPMIVMADADLDEAVNAANFGAFMHSGQICMATERIIVDSKVAGEFTDGLVKKASAMTVGDPTNPETMIGPLINKASVEHVTELVEDAKSKGAEVATGGEAEGPCFHPTVLTKVTPEMRVYSEESFGPIVADPRIRRHRRRDQDRERHQLRALGRGVQLRHPDRARRRQADRERDLPRQPGDRPRRGADAVRRRQGERLGPVRRQRGARGVHRPPLDHGHEPAGPLPDLMKAARRLIELAQSEGVDRVFGNPGTTELPFMDELAKVPEFHYYLGLHEGTAVSMADGYARATRRPSFLNLHIAAGLPTAWRTCSTPGGPAPRWWSPSASRTAAT